MEREMYLYECTDCVLVFGVETAYEDHSQIVCPVCKSDEAIQDAGCAMATLTRGPEVHDSVARCRVCGCTDNNACPEGCCWVEPDLCSSCVGSEHSAPLEEQELYDADENCEHEIVSASGGGIKCTKCSGWFCY